MSLSQESIIGKRYQIIGELGGGASSRTYLAEDTLLPGNPRRVVKKLQLTICSPLIWKDALNRFAREAEALAKLGNYPQIPQVFDYFEENQEFYLVQELIEGKDLSQELEEGKQLSEAEVIDLLQEILEILKFIHQQGVIHRDIKPSNLIRRKSDKKIVMIDFGAVKEISTLAANAEGKTIQTKAVGTAGYMAPEQLAGKPNYSSDIYALGMTAIQALTGVSPIELKRDSQDRVIWREQAWVSEKLAAILDKMVKSHYRERYQSVVEVINEICDIKNDKNQLKKLKYNEKITIAFVKKDILTKILAIISLLSMTINLVSLSGQKYNQSQGYVDEWEMGDNILIEERSEEAIAVFEKAIQRQPNNYVAWEYKGRTLLELERYEDALAAFDEAIELKPDYLTAWTGRGNALKKLSRYDEAIASYDKAIKKNSDGNEIQNNYNAHEALYYKVLVMCDLNWCERASKEFDKAIQLQPKNYVAWEYKGRTLLELERYEEARTAFDKAIELNPDYWTAWTGRGNALKNLGRYDEAIVSYDKAIKINSDGNEIQINSSAYKALYYKGLALYDLKRYSEAIAAFDQAIQLQPDDYVAWTKKGRTLLKLERYQEAIAAFDKAIELKPDYQEAIEARDLAQMQLKMQSLAMDGENGIDS